MKNTIPELITTNLIITVLKPDDYHLLANYERNNRDHLSKWEPLRSESYFTDKEVKERVALSFKNFNEGTSLSFVAFDAMRTRIVCVCNFTNIVYGVFQACNLGYSVNATDQGKGLMFEAVSTCIDYVFAELGLHRVMANYIATNKRSEKLLTRLGFEKEGIAKSYLKIAGSWQDHVLTSKINPNQVGI